MSSLLAGFACSSSLAVSSRPPGLRMRLPSFAKSQWPCIRPASGPDLSPLPPACCDSALLILDLSSDSDVDDERNSAAAIFERVVCCYSYWRGGSAPRSQGVSRITSHQGHSRPGPGIRSTRAGNPQHTKPLAAACAAARGFGMMPSATHYLDAASALLSARSTDGSSPATI